MKHIQVLQIAIIIKMHIVYDATQQRSPCQMEYQLPFQFCFPTDQGHQYRYLQLFQSNIHKYIHCKKISEVGKKYTEAVMFCLISIRK